MEIRLKLFFASLFLLISPVSTEQSQICVRNSVLVKQVRGDPYGSEQPFPLIESAKLLITTSTLSIEIPAQENLLQKCEEPVERLPQPDRSIKICTDAGFLKTVEVGQYFMTKHTDEFLQFAESVTSREFLLPRNEKSTDPKDGIRGNTRIGPVLEVRTSYLQGKYGVEIRIESVNKHNSHSWVRISHGFNKLITLDRQSVRRQWGGNLWNEDDSICVCKPIKGWSKIEKIFHYLLINKNCIYSWKNMDWYCTRSSIRSSVPSGKKTKHPASARRVSSWRLKDGLRNEFEHSQYWSDDVWKSKVTGGGGNKKQVSILYWFVRTRNSLSPSSSRSFRTQSHWSYTAGQCVNSEQFLRVHFSCWMCSQFTLHHKFRIDSGRTKF